MDIIRVDRVVASFISLTWRLIYRGTMRNWEETAVGPPESSLIPFQLKNIL